MGYRGEDGGNTARKIINALATRSINLVARITARRQLWVSRLRAIAVHHMVDPTLSIMSWGGNGIRDTFRTRISSSIKIMSKASAERIGSHIKLRSLSRLVRTQFFRAIWARIDCSR
jgi:hypothetical protein